MEVFAAWCAMRLVLREGSIIMENVRGLKTQMLAKVFSDDYTIDVLETDPTNHGVPSRRPRSIWHLAAKDKISLVKRPLVYVNTLFHRRCVASFDIYMTADMDELEAELAWAGSRPSSEVARCLSTCPHCF